VVVLVVVLPVVVLVVVKVFLFFFIDCLGKSSSCNSKRYHPKIPPLDQ
jgi:hypothetical protein